MAEAAIEFEPLLDSEEAAKLLGNDGRISIPTAPTNLSISNFIS